MTMTNAELLEAYGPAVARLADIARRDTSASRAAAQVLLSAYNGYEWHLDVTDLCLLDAPYLEDALTVMRARATLNHEPHHTIVDGDRIFLALWDQWGHLHTLKRHA